MEKNQEFIYKQIETAYYFLSDRLLVRQDTLFKTYLWSGSLALALNMSLLKDCHELFPLSLSAGFSLVSLILAFFVIVFCLDSLRGRPGQQMSFPDFGGHLAHLEQYDQSQVMQALAKDWMDDLNHQRTTQSLRGRKLQASSWLLILSFCFLAGSGIAAILQ